MTPVEQLQRAALEAPEAKVFYGDAAVSYTELLDRSLRAAAGLKKLGIGPGDRVAFWLPNSLPYLDLLYACMHVGAIAVSINTRFRRAEAQSILSRTGASAIVLWPGFKDIPFIDMLGEIDPAAISGLRVAILCETMSADVPVEGISVVCHEELLRETPAESAADPEARCMIFPTSGTTSAPKFAVHTQGRIARHAAQVASAFGYDAPDAHLLQAVPFCGIYGFSQWAATVAGQASASLMPLFEPRSAGELVRARGITHLNGPDDLLKRLLDAFPEQRPFPTLRESLFASFNPTLADFIHEADARGLHIINGFGMSEIFSFFSRRDTDAPPDLRKHPGGVPVNPAAKVRVRDTDTGEIAPQGQVGSLEIRSDTLFVEYWGDPDATRAAFTGDGYFVTGDLASMEDDRSFCLLGRDGDFLRLGGFLVNPSEIEFVLKDVTGGIDIVVVEAESPRGNKAIAYYRLAAGQDFDENEVRRRAKALLADFKVPQHFIQVESFPVAMSPNGEKIQRRRLKEMATEFVAKQTAHA
jgi:fatty-acyl-CoA synthase